MSKKLVKFTDMWLKTLQPAPPGKCVEWRDSVVNGLAMRTRNSGKSTYLVIGTVRGERITRRFTIGRVARIGLAAAREEARRVLEEMALGRVPVTQVKARREAERAAKAAEAEAKRARAAVEHSTFAKAAADYIRAKVSKTRRAIDTEREIQTVLVARWGQRPIGEITRKDVTALIGEFTAAGKLHMARNHLGNVKALFNWCIVSGSYAIEHSPTDRLKVRDLIGAIPARDRVLTDGEIRAVWNAAIELGYPWGDLVRMLLLTGQRRGEIAHATWSEFDLEGRTPTVPAARMKKGRTHTTPLSADAMALIEGLPHKDGLLFRMPSGRRLTAFNRGKSEVDALIAAGRPLAPWRIHDLRRTVRSNFSAIGGVSDVVREMAIAHMPSGVRAVYDRHEYHSELRQLFEEWAVRLRAIVGDNVVSLPVKRA
jgi:integrase